MSCLVTSMNKSLFIYLCIEETPFGVAPETEIECPREIDSCEQDEENNKEDPRFYSTRHFKFTQVLLITKTGSLRCHCNR